MNRARLARDFAEVDYRRSWKTFVLEAHIQDGNDARGLLEDAFTESRVEGTDDVCLHRLAGDVEFMVDHLDDRFWSFHTTDPSRDAGSYIRRVIGSRRDLDWMWLPSGHLNDVWPDTLPEWVATDFITGRLAPSASDISDLRLRVRGVEADQVLRLIEGRYGMTVPKSHIGIHAVDDQLGSITEAISHDGRFVAKGDDFGFHQTIVRQMVGRYRDLIEAIERRSLKWVDLHEGGSLLHGAPITLRFSRPIVDLDMFLDNLFSAREPFRLWGIPRYSEDQTVEVEAVDLHVGQQLRFDISTEWLRVYLFEGGCGNTVARLVSNLQHHLDGAISIVDRELSEAVA